MKQLTLLYEERHYFIAYCFGSKSPQDKTGWSNLIGYDYVDLELALKELKKLVNSYSAVPLKIVDQENYLYYVYDPAKNLASHHFRYRFFAQRASELMDELTEQLSHEELLQKAIKEFETHKGVYEVNGQYKWYYA